MAQINAQKALDKRKRERANKPVADPNVVKGEVPENVLEELVQAKAAAKAWSSGFSEAVKAQAEKYGVKPAALRKFITAKEADKLDEAEAETNDLVKLLG